MNIGQLRQRIIIETPTTSQDTAGGVTQTWSTFLTVWASVEPLNGHKLFQAKQANADVTGIIKIRYQSGIEPNMRVKYGSRILSIVSIINTDERNIELQIMYKEALD
ncbi:MAG: phage head closure protein [Candidatus Doudnabacteria bacterium]|jgi:SPP1 family predicted phage head-tail adaptor